MRPPVKNTGKQATAAAVMTGMSNRRAAGSTATPWEATAAEAPKTPRMLKMLLPTTLPIAMSRSPRMPATSDVASSGSEVPPATMVSPISNSLTPSQRDKSTAPWTNQPAPKTNNTRPATTEAAEIAN
jgi:hypothetical protein